jgi:SSS family solute:Na+ symporter
MEGGAAVAPGGGPAAVAAFVAYLALVVGLGVWSARFSSAGIAEFFVGGRRMNRFVVALSAVASGRSAWLLLGVTGMAYSRGASAVWAVVGYIVMEVFLFLYYGRRLRRFAGRFDCVTVPDFFAVRLGEESGEAGGPHPGGGRRGGAVALRAALVTVILLFMVGYVAAQFVAGGKAFAAGFGLSPTAGLLLTAGIVLAYTVLGGFLAVSLTDLVQAVFMLFALVVLPVAAIAARGGLGAVLAEVAALDPALVDPAALGFGAFLGFVGIGLGSPGSPHILARYMSIADAEQLRVAAVAGTVWNVLMAWGALFIGIAGRAFFPAVEALPGADPENLYPLLAGQLLHPVLFGVVLASIFAAIMSTADSQLLVAASSLVRDLYEKVLRRGRPVPQRRLVLLSRLAVAALVGLALLLGFAAEDLVFWLVLFAWAGLGAALGPTSILALYWRRTTRAGVLAGLAAGTVVTLVWKLVPALSGRLYELIPGFLAGLAATVLVSLATRPPAEVEAMFDAMERPLGVEPAAAPDPRR